MSADDLARFIADRLDEHEQGARAAEVQNPPPWYAVDGMVTGGVVRGVSDQIDGDLWDREGGSDRLSMRVETAEHIARHDPAHVLAFVAAGRAIIEQHHRYAEDEPETRHQDACVGCGLNGSGGYWVPNINDCPTLRAFGAIWAGHPAWREEWRA